MNKTATMQQVLRLQTRVKEKGAINLEIPQLTPGDDVEILIILPHAAASESLSVMDVLEQASGQRIFKTADDVDTYLQDERSSWDQ